MNFIASPNFAEPLSQALDNTLRSVMPHLGRVVIDEQYSIYNDDPKLLVNVAYIYRKPKGDESKTVYTDDKNTVFYDKPQEIMTGTGSP